MFNDSVIMYIKLKAFNINAIRIASRGTDMPTANHGPTLPKPPGSVSFSILSCANHGIIAGVLQNAAIISIILLYVWYLMLYNHYSRCLCSPNAL